MAVDTIDTTTLISQSAFGKIIGMSRQYVNKLVKEGKLPNVNGKINPNEALEAWQASKDFNRDPQRKANAERYNKSNNFSYLNDRVKNNLKNDNYKPEFGDVSNVKSLSVTEVGQETQKSKLVSETYKAKISQKEFEILSGSVVYIEDVAETNGRIASTIRSALLGMGSKLSPSLVGLSANEIRIVIEDEVNDILSVLNDLKDVYDG